MRERIFISGANGFIGKHLKYELTKRGYETIAIPREFLTLDSIPLYNEAMRLKPSYIFHLAAYGNHGMQNNRFDTLNINILGTFNLLESVSEVKYKAFVNVATSSMYGHSMAPMKETDSFKPDTYYAATKASAAYLARAHAKVNKKPIVNVIPFSIFGEGEADWRFIPTACKHMLTGEKMSFVPWPTHDWLYVRDFVDAIIHLALNAKEARGDFVNIGSGNMYTNDEVIKTLTNISKLPLETQNDYPELPHHSPVWKANIEILKKSGFKPKFTFEQALSNTWKYYKKKYEAELNAKN